MDAEKLSPLVWGPHVWHTLFTFALAYPQTPNSVTRRKYYDFIQNLPVFLPNAEIRKTFGTLLEDYPVQPYLKTRESFIHWIHFIHNRINRLTGRPEITLYEAMDRYYAQYKTPTLILSEKWGVSKGTLHNIVILGLLAGIIYLSNTTQSK